MREDKGKNVDFMKLSLYLISLWILFFMLIILKLDVSMVPFAINRENINNFARRNVISCICLGFIILGEVGYLRFRDSLNNAKQLPVEIKKCESINYENLSFLATYIIPLVCFPMETEREIFVMFSVIVIIGCIFVKTNLYHINPFEINEFDFAVRPNLVIPLPNPSYTVKKILTGYSFEGLY
ncbi:MAG: hypothetical protein NC541_10360 [bacterium]|nr:hypothetical protein [bacterium]